MLNGYQLGGVRERPRDAGVALNQGLANSLGPGVKKGRRFMANGNGDPKVSCSAAGYEGKQLLGTPG